MQRSVVYRLMAGAGLLLAWTLTPVVYAQQGVVLPPSNAWITDQADLLSPTEEQALTRRLRFYADSTSTQIVIVTVADLGGADIAQYATELGQQWGVGQQGKDNGAVILVSRDDREVFIATGYGLEGAIPDAVAGRIVRAILVPNFKQGRFYEGISGAVDALILAASGEFTADQLSPNPSANEREDVIGLLFVLFIIILFVLSAIRRGGGGGRYHRRRGGPPVIIWGGGGFSGGGGFGGGGGFSGGGGGFGGGGAGGSW